MVRACRRWPSSTRKKSSSKGHWRFRSTSRIRGTIGSGRRCPPTACRGRGTLQSTRLIHKASQALHDAVMKIGAKNIFAPQFGARLTRGFSGHFRHHNIWWVRFRLPLTACGSPLPACPYFGPVTSCDHQIWRDQIAPPLGLKIPADGKLSPKGAAGASWGRPFHAFRGASHAHSPPFHGRRPFAL